MRKKGQAKGNPGRVKDDCNSVDAKNYLGRRVALTLNGKKLCMAKVARIMSNGKVLAVVEVSQ